MQVKQLKQDGLSRQMEVTVTAKDIDARVDVRLKEVGKTIRMPGFRPGHIPMPILKQRYGKTVMGEVLELAVNETSAKALSDNNLRPAFQPKIEVKSFDDGKDLVYTMDVEVLPDFKIADFKGVKLEKLVAKPGDTEVEQAMGRLAEMREQTRPVTAKRGAKDGDTLHIAFRGRTADDNVAHAGMQSESHRLKLGSGQFIPGFEDQLIGAKAGSTVEVKVGFPENYGAKDLAGREAIFDVDVKELHEPSEAVFDDEFAKGFGAKDIDTLKKAIADQVGKEFEQHSRMVMKKHLLDFLDDAHDFEIPPRMLEMEYKNILDQIELERRRNPELAKEPLGDAEKEEFREISARRIRLGLVLSEIGRVNKIQVGDAELQRAVIAEAQKYPGQERQVFDYYAKNRNALESMRAPLFEDKVVDFIFGLAKVEEKTVTPDELMKALDAEDEAPKKKPAAKKAPAKKADATEAAPKDEKAEKKAPAKKATAKK